MSFTGERYVAALDSPQIAYEHWHRYLFAASLTRGMSVLDVASGEGYGSALLARTAREVVGVDISAEAVEHAASRYPAPNLRFIQGSAGAIPFEGRERFDAVVSFETIEHVQPGVQESFIAETKRLLRPGGLLIISTPNKLVYSDQLGYRNEFHVKEFYAEEFRQFLGRSFRNVEFLAQRVFCASHLWTLDRRTPAAAEFLLERTADGFRPSDRQKPELYLVALCSDGDLPGATGSLLVDLDDRLQRGGGDQAGQQGRRAAILERGLAVARERIACLEAELVQRGAAGPGRLPSPALEMALRATRSLGHPVASIVIPVFNKVEYTRRCLEKIVENTPGELFEVVVVDDASSDTTPELLAGLEGDVSVIRNPANQGFVVSCNQGAAAAKGKYLLFLNNDTAPQPGWLEAMVAAAEADPLVGAVGSKLVYPDGNLQEAGGIVFSDASAWNHGRGDDPDRPDYAEPCEVDYCSGASLLVRKDLFDRLGGFDLRYAPAYYEDTDLCFGVRSLGFKVVYCPASVVVHHEGITAGTDRSSGVKRYQEVNRAKFLAKWRDDLRRQPDPPSVTGRIPRTASRQQTLAASAEKASVLVVDPLMPLFDRASGSLRLFRLLEIFRKEGCHVTFVARNAQGQHQYRKPLEAMGVRVFAGDPERMAQLGKYVRGPRVDFGQILGERPFDLAWLSFYYLAEQYMPLFRALSPRTLVVADSVDVHYLREMREAEVKGDLAGLAAAKKARERELAVYRKADVVVAVTDADRAELEQGGLGTPVVVVPNVHEVHAAPTPGFEARRGMVFVGSFAHPPNVDAATWFVAEVLPRIRQRAPDAELSIIGASPPPAVKALAGPGVAVHGWVPDTAPFLDSARVSVAPLRFGAGMKGKIGEALGRGLPVVTTSVGAEGMGLRHGDQALIADAAEAFAEGVLRLHGDGALWGALATRGRALVAARYSPEVVAGPTRMLLDVARQHARGPAPVAARAG